MKNVFFFDESMSYPNKFLIRINPSYLPEHIMRGSYAVLEARLMMLSWTDYLRLCRDVYGGELIGKDQLFVTAYFSDKNTARPLLNELNKRINEILV